MLKAIIPRLPRTLVWCIGQWTGSAGYFLMPGWRRVGMANVEAAFGSEKSGREKRTIVRASLQNFASTLLLHFWTPRLDPAQFKRLVEVDWKGLERLREMHSRGKGLIGLTLHYGDWEMVGLAIGLLGEPFTVVVQSISDAFCDRVFNELRAHSGNRTVPRHRAAGVALRALRNGERVAFANDLNPRRDGGVWVRFFGLSVFSDSAAARLAVRTGAPIIYAVAHPLGRGKFRLTFSNEIQGSRRQSPEDDVREITQRCLDYCERIIRDKPEFWHWCYKRWKRLPSKQAHGYPFYASYVRVRETGLALRRTPS